MLDPYLSTVVQTGERFDELLTFLNIQYQSNREPVGYKIENASSSPALTRIDKNFEDFTPGADFFHNHELFQFPKCILLADGTPYFGSNFRGDGLNTTGYIEIDGVGYYGDLMARIQNPQYRYIYEEENDTQYYLFAPHDSSHVYFDYYPSAYCGGGTRQKYFYLACYEGSMGVDTSGNKIIKSVSGAQPWTGEEIRSLSFTSGGQTPFTTGEQLIGATSGATGYVVDYHVNSGTWSGGDASGIVYLSLPGIKSSTATAFQSEALTGSISGADCATSNGAASTLSLSINDALIFATNKGVGWTVNDIYSNSLLRKLFYTQFGTRDSQTTIGNGIVSYSVGAGFAGKLTGADNIANYVDIYGTGMDPETNGYTPIVWNNLENVWGNCEEWIAGINIINDGSCRIINPDGTKSISGTLTENSYITLSGSIPLTDGYPSKIQTDSVGALFSLPSELFGTSSTGMCDVYLYPRVSIAAVRTSGNWSNGYASGINYICAYDSPTYSSKYACARLKYIPQS